MAYQVPGHCFGTLIADADLTGSIYCVVKYAAGGEAALAGANERHVLGVLQNKPNTGEECEIMTSGVSKAKAGAAISEGALLTTDASGRVVTATSNEFIIGTALAAAGAAGEYIPMLISKGETAA